MPQARFLIQVMSFQILFFLVLSAGAMLAMTGCVSLPFEVAGDVIEATGDVVETAVEVPIDVATSMVSVPSSKHFHAKYTEYPQWDLDPDEIHAIRLELPNGSVKVHGRDEGPYSVSARIEVYARTESAARDYVDGALPLMKTEDGVHRIYHTLPAHTRHYRCQIHYEIVVPLAMDLDISTQNAGTDVENVCGDIRIHTQNGKIKLWRCAGALSVSTQNGEIEAERLAVRGPAKVDTQNGSIRLAMTEIGGPMDVQSNNGSIKLCLPQDFQGRLDARNENGSLSSDLPIRVGQGTRHQLTGRIGDQEEPVLFLRSQNGDIKLRVNEEGD